MPQTVRGVISRSKQKPVELVDIVIPDPGPGEVVVDVIACGVCHTDLTYREGGINDEFPFLLGHEAAARAWLEGPNTDLGARPVELIRSAEGLVRVVHYLDAHRGRV